MNEAETGPLQQKMAGKIFMTEEAMRGRIEHARRSKTRGRIMPTDVDAKNAADRDNPDVIPAAEADIISGVIAATVATNRIMPVAYLPSTWDVLACFFAILDGSFSGFRLPARGHYLREYAVGLADAEFDIEAFDLDPPKQNLVNVRDQRDFAIQALARCDQAGLDALLAVTGSDIVMHPLTWAGPWHADEQYLMSLRLNPHSMPDGYYYHTPETDNIRVTVPTVETVEAGDHALVDITFMTIDGGAWNVYPVRIR